MSLSNIEEAIKDFAAGKLIIVVDDEDRENEGDLILAAEMATKENIAFMIRHTSGIICAPAEEERLTELELPIMVEQNSDPLRTAFTVSTDYIRGMTTGVSAEERANTLRALANSEVVADDFIRPGHIFPLRYRAGGVLVRSGHTEAAIDLCKLAGLKSVGALAELNHDDGTMMRMPALKDFAATHGLHIISIESLIKYRAEHDVLISEIATNKISLNGANFDAHIYKTVFDGKLITAVVKGNIQSDAPTLVRVIKGSKGRDFMSSAMVAGNVISTSLRLISEADQGVFIYLPPSEEVEIEDEQSGAVWREVGLGSHILSSLGVRRIHLLASKELTYPGIASFGLQIETIIKEE